MTANKFAFNANHLPATRLLNVLRTVSVLGLSMLLSACNPPEPPVAEVAALHIAQSESYIRAGQYHAANIEASNAIQKAPQLSEGYLLLAQIYNELGRYKAALEVLDTTPAESHDEWRYISLRLQALQGRGKFESAETLLTANTSQQGQYKADYLSLRAKNYLGQKNYNAAKNEYTKLLALLETSENKKDLRLLTDAFANLATIANLEGNTAQVVTWLEKLDKTDPDSIAAGLLKAEIARQKGELDKAEIHLTDTLIKLKDTDTLTPQRADILRALADVLIKQGRSAEALVYTQILSEAFPGFDVAQEELRRATALYQKNQKEEAEAILQKLVDDYPKFESAAIFLAVIKFEKSDFVSAAELFNPNVDPELAASEITEISALSNLQANNPDKVLSLLGPIIDQSANSNLLAIYGSAALSKGNTDLGKKSLIRALKLNPDNILALSSLADYYATANTPDLEEALQLLQKARQLNPKSTALTSKAVKYLLASGDQKSAGALVDKQLADLPNAASSLILAGDYFGAISAPDKAERYYEQALASDPKSFAAALKLAELQYFYGKDFTPVQNAYLRAIEIQPDNLTAYKRLIEVSIKKGQLETAASRLKAFAKDSGYQEGLLLLAIHSAQTGDILSADNYLTIIDKKALPEKLYATAQQNINYYNALTYLQMQKLPDAKQAVFKALAIDPRSIPLLALLAEIEIASKDYAEAKRLAGQLEKVNAAVGKKLLGDIALAEGNEQIALNYYQSSWLSTANEPAAQQLHAILENDAPDQARRFLEEWSEKMPHSMAAKMLTARNMLIQGQYRNSIPLMQSIRESNPDNATNLNNLAWALSQLNDAEALQIAEQAYRLDPKNPNILDTYGWILFQQDQLDKAIKILEKAHNIAPDNAEIKAHLDSVKSQS